MFITLRFKQANIEEGVKTVQYVTKTSIKAIEYANKTLVVAAEIAKWTKAVSALKTFSNFLGGSGALLSVAFTFFADSPTGALQRVVLKEFKKGNLKLDGLQSQLQAAEENILNQIVAEKDKADLRSITTVLQLAERKLRVSSKDYLFLFLEAQQLYRQTCGFFFYFSLFFSKYEFIK